MPKDFEWCVKQGGKVKTIKPKGKSSKTYIRVCYYKGKSYTGEVKKKKDKEG